MLMLLMFMMLIFAFHLVVYLVVIAMINPFIGIEVHVDVVLLVLPVLQEVLTTIVHLKVSIVFYLLTNSVLKTGIESERVSKIRSLIFCVCCRLSDFFFHCWFLGKVEKGRIDNLMKSVNTIGYYGNIILEVLRSMRSCLESLLQTFDQLEKKQSLNLYSKYKTNFHFLPIYYK